MWWGGKKAINQGIGGGFFGGGVAMRGIHARVNEGNSCSCT